MQQFQAPQISPINKIILITSVAIFVISSILEKAMGVSLLPYLALSSKTIFNGHLYQLATFNFMERDLMNIIFNALIIWFVGSDLERLWGKKLYTHFLMTCSLSTALIYILITAGVMGDELSMSFPLFGMSSMCYGLLGAYAIIYSDRQFTFMFLFPMKAMWFCVLLGAIQLYSAIFSTYSKSAWAHLAGLVFGITFLRFKSFVANKQRQVSNIKKNKSKANLYVVKGDDDDKPKFYH